jgi:outer membrane biosynthesis protein TonB
MSTNGTAIEDAREILPLAEPQEGQLEIKRGGRTVATLATTKKSAVVKVPLSVEQAKKEWENYLALCIAILEEQDYIFFVRYAKPDGYEGKPIACRRKKDAEEKAKQMTATGMKGVEVSQSKKRSAWDKLAKFYNLTLPSSVSGPDPNIKVDVFLVGESIIEKRSGDGFTIIIYQHSDNQEIIKASATVVVSAPNGRTAVGEGVCSVKERKLGADSFAHADHDIPSTAFTRALNRAISRCLGTGEVSADEIEGETPASAEPAAQPPQVAKAPEVQALPAVPSSRPNERTEATPPQAAPVADTPKTAQSQAVASPQASSDEPSKTAKTNTEIAPTSTPPESPAASDSKSPNPGLAPPAEAVIPPTAAPAMTVERVAEKLDATVTETKDAETVRKGLADRINVFVRDVLTKTDMKNVAANVQSFIKICADVPTTASPKQIPTNKLQVIVDIMEHRLKKDGPSGLASMIYERNRAGRKEGGK